MRGVKTIETIIKKVGVFCEGNIRNPVYGSLVTLFSQPLNIV